MIIINMLSRLTTIVKHPQFQKMKNYYTTGLPFAIMIGGMTGTMLGISNLDKYTDKPELRYIPQYMDKNEYRSVMLKPNSGPLKPFGLIIGSFSLGLISGFFYPILIPVSAVYAINTIIETI
jgi:hypothetical protein